MQYIVFTVFLLINLQHHLTIKIVLLCQFMNQDSYDLYS